MNPFVSNVELCQQREHRHRINEVSKGQVENMDVFGRCSKRFVTDDDTDDEEVDNGDEKRENNV